MTEFALTVRRHAQHLVTRAVVVSALALLALLLPDVFFYDALIGVSSVSIVFGLYEATIRLESSTRQPGYGRLAVLSGITTASFGVLTMALLFTDLRTGVFLTAAWLALHASTLALASSALKAHTLVRLVLVAFAVLHAGAALAVTGFLTHPRIGSLAIPIAGALYALGLGVWQGVAGLWLRNLAMTAGNAPDPSASAAGLPTSSRDVADPISDFELGRSLRF